MANDIRAFFTRLTAAANEYNKALVGTVSALDAVYLDLKPEPVTNTQTIRIFFPDVGEYTDQVANDWKPEDFATPWIDVPFGERPGKALKFHDFEQVLTNTDLIAQFLDPNYKRAMEYANGAIFRLINTANFNAYPPITTPTGQLDVPSARLAWNLLVRNKIPITGPADASILYHPDIHANTLTDTTWYQENLVGALIAQGTRQNAATPDTAANVAFNFTRRFDQQAPTTDSAALTGTATVTNGSAAVTGAGSAFLTQAPVGSWIKYGTDTTYYPVKAVGSDTALTLGMNYTGTGGSGKAMVRTTYTGVAMHRYAIALAVRPLQLVNDGTTSSQIIKLKGLPIRMMVSYQHQLASYLLTFDYVMTAKVIRPNFGVVFQS